MRVCRFLAALLAVSLLLSGCGKAPSGPATETFFAMDTVMTLTVYGTRAVPDPGEVLSEARTLVQWLEHTLSVTDPDGPLYAVNRDGGGEVLLETGETVQEALRLCDWTGGALDVTMYPVSLAWGFTAGDHRVPDRAELDALLARVDYRRVQTDLRPGEGTAEISLDPGMMLDLGAVAKGLTGDRLGDLLLRRLGENVSALLDLGGNVVAVGAKPDGSPWRVGIRDPENPDGLLGVLSAVNKTVITSGGYERYFEENGLRYWHILDPATGEPARSGLKSVTVVGSCAAGMKSDALSTALFVMGPENAAAFWRENAAAAFDMILADDAGGVTITEGLRDSFTLGGAWKDAPLTILTRE